mmetsp:Transcript_48626/g.137467  ORF Transcript_48626/g.137467 Transcript_48626/m.137467 type:complete len:369 (+) Transcript_48626:417-1523(+)
MRRSIVGAPVSGEPAVVRPCSALSPGRELVPAPVVGAPLRAQVAAVQLAPGPRPPLLPEPEGRPVEGVVVPEHCARILVLFPREALPSSTHVPARVSRRLHLGQPPQLLRQRPPRLLGLVFVRAEDHGERLQGQADAPAEHPPEPLQLHLVPGQLELVSHRLDELVLENHPVQVFVEGLEEGADHLLVDVLHPELALRQQPLAELDGLLVEPVLPHPQQELPPPPLGHGHAPLALALGLRLVELAQELLLVRRRCWRRQRHGLPHSTGLLQPRGPRGQRGPRAGLHPQGRAGLQRLRRGRLRRVVEVDRRGPAAAGPGRRGLGALGGRHRVSHFGERQHARHLGAPSGGRLVAELHSGAGRHRRRGRR